MPLNNIELCTTCPYINYKTGENITEKYCEKLGTRISQTGCCEEVDNLKKNIPYRHNRSLNSYKRDVKRKNKLKRIANAEYAWMSFGWKTENDWWSDDPGEKLYVKRHYRGKRSKYIKKIAARKARKFTGDLANGSQYKKLYDFWWELY